MNLLYIWRKDYYSTNEGKEYLLNSKYDIKFQEKEKGLSIKLNDNYIQGLWGEHVFDVMAVVGENGSGKTELANCIMEILQKWSVENNHEYGFQLIIIFEDEIEKEIGLKLFVTNEFSKLLEEDRFIDSSIAYKCSLLSESKEYEKFKFGYFTDILSKSDYMNIRDGNIFDASLGGRIRQFRKYDYGMNYIKLDKDIIRNYFEDEIKEMINFIGAIKKKNSDLKDFEKIFVLPKTIKISLNQYSANLEYILNDLTEMEKGEEKIKTFRRNLEEKAEYILTKYENSWCSYLIVNLIFNLFKDMCISQTTGENLEEEAFRFLKIIGNIDEFKDITVFEMMLELLEELQKLHKGRNQHKIEAYKDFTEWLSQLSFFQENQLRADQEWILDISKDEESIVDLLEHYEKTNFAYPYLIFDFGLSAGELHFLKLFSQISELLQKESSLNKSWVVNNFSTEIRCENLLLFLDEVDLSLHPRWQQNFLDWLLKFIDIKFKHCSVQVIMASHSPMMLTDFPQDNVLYLEKDGEKRYAKKRDIKTFGNNLHSLFLDSFFLDNDGTMGTFARRKINEIARELNNSNTKENENILKTINFIGDDIIRNKLLQMYEANHTVVKEPEMTLLEEELIDTIIKQYKKHIDDLNSAIRELEKKRIDKN